MDKIQTPPVKNNYFQPNTACTPFRYSSNNVFDKRNNQYLNQQKVNKYIITSRKVKETFKLFAIDNKYLNKHAFNDALEFLFSNIPIPALHHTYLSNQLYNIFNLSGNSKLNEEEFLKCIKQILSNKNNRLHLSMMAMMSYPNKVRKTIDLDELKNFFYESFVQGYKHMAYKINEKPDELKMYGLPIASVSQIEAWAREFEKRIKNGFEKDLKMFDSTINESISFDQYRKWIFNDQTLYIKYGHKEFKIATSLIIFDVVEYQEN